MSNLYQRDLKNFIGLRNAQINVHNRRECVNQDLLKKKPAAVLNNQRYTKGCSLVMTKYDGDDMQKFLFEGIEDVDPNDVLSNQANMKLLSIYQSIDTSKYYRRLVEDPVTKRSKLVIESE